MLFDSTAGLITGSVVVPNAVGSVAVTTSPLTVSGNMISLGSPGFKLAQSSTSGTFKSVWDPGASNKVEIHGWDISSQVAMQVIVKISGASTVAVQQYHIPASGVLIKTFVSPIAPGANAQIFGFGQTAAGSVDMVVYGRAI